MNEQIKALADQSKVTVITTKGDEWVIDGCYIVSPAKLQEFAELIIAGALHCVKDEMNDPTSDLSYHSLNSIQARINKHFGV